MVLLQTTHIKWILGQRSQILMAINLDVVPAYPRWLGNRLHYLVGLPRAFPVRDFHFQCVMPSRMAFTWFCKGPSSFFADSKNFTDSSQVITFASNSRTKWNVTIWSVRIRNILWIGKGVKTFWEALIFFHSNMVVLNFFPY